MRNPRFEDDALAEMEAPDIEKICCKNCFLRAKDVKFGGTVTPGATLDRCDVFDMKPVEIMDEYQKCPYFIDEKEGGE